MTVPVYVQGDTDTDGGGDGGVSIIYPAAPTEGNLLVAVLTAGNQGLPMTWPGGGWIEVPDDGTTFVNGQETPDNNMGIGYKIAGASEIADQGDIDTTSADQVVLHYGEWSHADGGEPTQTNERIDGDVQVNTLSVIDASSFTPAEVVGVAIAYFRGDDISTDAALTNRALTDGFTERLYADVAVTEPYGMILEFASKEIDSSELLNPDFSFDEVADSCGGSMVFFRVLATGSTVPRSVRNARLTTVRM